MTYTHTTQAEKDRAYLLRIGVRFVFIVKALLWITLILSLGIWLLVFIK